MSNSTKTHNTSAAWFKRRIEHWQKIENSLPQLEHNKTISKDTVLEVIRLYPEMARDLAIARRISPEGRLTQHLARTYATLHRAIFRPPKSTFKDITRLFTQDIPFITALISMHILSVTVGFICSVFVGWWLIINYPELISLFASESMIEKVQSGELWTDGLLNIFPSSLLSIQIFANNIMVAITTLSLGVLYGLGTIYIIGLNGLMLGGMFAFTAQYGMEKKLFEFICAHGFVELSVICIAGAIGFYIGESLARPGHLTRSAAFQNAVANGCKLMLLCVIFLVGAGIIEGYVSPNASYSLNQRLVIGLGYWFLFLFALSGWRIPRSKR